MTLGKKSKNSLKQWVATIRRYEYELPRLYEKLEYLEVKSIGYNSPSFEPKFGGRSTSNNYSIDYWLEKIDDCKRKIELFEKEISRFYGFISDLITIEKEVFIKYYYKGSPPRAIISEINCNRSKFYEVINRLYKLYLSKHVD